MVGADDDQAAPLRRQWGAAAEFLLTPPPDYPELIRPLADEVPVDAVHSTGKVATARNKTVALTLQHHTNVHLCWAQHFPVLQPNFALVSTGHDEDETETAGTGEAPKRGSHQRKPQQFTPAERLAIQQKCLEYEDEHWKHLPTLMGLSIGMQVVVLHNLDPENGTANGTLGNVFYLGYNRDAEARGQPIMPNATSPEAAQYQPQLPVLLVRVKNPVPGMVGISPELPDVICVPPVQSEFRYRISDGNGHTRLVHGYHVGLPVKPAQALTIHSETGLEFDSSYIHTEECFGICMAYVAASRVRQLHGLYFSKAITEHTLIPGDKSRTNLAELIAEDDRLFQLGMHTKACMEAAGEMHPDRVQAAMGHGPLTAFSAKVPFFEIRQE